MKLANTLGIRVRHHGTSESSNTESSVQLIEISNTDTSGSHLDILGPKKMLPGGTKHYSSHMQVRKLSCSVEDGNSQKSRNTLGVQS